MQFKELADLKSIIASNIYYNSTPFKIKVTELTKCTILFDNLDSDTKNIRMFIDKMNNEYDIVESITNQELSNHSDDDLPF